MPQPDAELVLSITGILTDYRQSDIKPITPQHVIRWIEQFDVEDRAVILAETERILSLCYLSRAKMAQDIQILVANGLHLYSEFEWYKLEFLQIQRKGSSQSNLLYTFIPEVLEFNPYFEDPEVYIYLDDCLFSGNSLIYDIRAWLESGDVQDTELHILFHTVYRAGWRYAQQKLTPLFQQRNIICNWDALHVLSNELQSGQPLDCLWPTQGEAQTDIAASYIEKVRESASARGASPRLYRPYQVELKETLFSSPQARDIVEQAFLKAGIHIVSLPKNAKPEMRPLGHEKLASLGFGAVYVTYRNVSNNCPLALWWGDPSYPTHHPFSQWYPLLPRKANT